MKFHNLSKTITKELDKKTKKNMGIFFTPPTIIKKILQILFVDNNFNIQNILEPSCGSCEFIRYLDKLLSNVNITGIEFNHLIFNKIKDISWSKKNNIQIIENNYLLFEDDAVKYDLIIGNPPYFVMKKREIHQKKYLKLIDGRPNIFTLFIIHSFEKLKMNGIIAFVLPKNFINCLYYNKLRKYIYEHFE